jgi:O-antigen/teichoic acid export membrane protein
VTTRPTRFDSQIASGSASRAEAGGSHSSQVLRGSVWFIAAVGIGAAGGFAFWWLAVRLRPPEIVGQASALFTVILWISFLTSMGLPVAVARYGSSEHRSTHSLWSWALAYTTVGSLVGCILFLLLAPADLIDDLGSAFSSWGFPLQLLFLFVMVNGMAFAVLVETRLVTLRHWGWVLGRVAVISVVRLPLLFAGPLARSSIGLVILMAGTPALSGGIGVLALRRQADRHARKLRPVPKEARPALRFATVNWLGMLAAQAPQFTVPLIIATQVSSAAYAAFYLAWTMTTVTFLLPQTIGQVVLSEGSREKSSLDHQVRLGLVAALGAMTALTIGAVIFAPLATTIFGKDYASTGDLLPPLIAAGIPWAVTAILLARARVLGQTGVTVAITITFAVLGLGLVSGAVSSSNLQDAAWAWLLANVLSAFAAVAYTLVAHRRVKQPTVDLLLPFDGA